ncbi:Hypothetical predicted protein [Octopus vulgaris]|uniref:Uncharacterized protein n=1 Tax=Octopus vulgaris TaxID=6645 RepID=A0AA36AXW2_OCTVU|nr:Hypothetical predicted protein [Octopus vulgaris]
MTPKSSFSYRTTTRQRHLSSIVGWDITRYKTYLYINMCAKRYYALTAYNVFYDIHTPGGGGIDIFRNFVRKRLK